MIRPCGQALGACMLGGACQTRPVVVRNQTPPWIWWVVALVVPFFFVCLHEHLTIVVFNLRYTGDSLGNNLISPLLLVPSLFAVRVVNLLRYSQSATYEHTASTPWNRPNDTITARLLVHWNNLPKGITHYAQWKAQPKSPCLKISLKSRH